MDLKEVNNMKTISKLFLLNNFTTLRESFFMKLSPYIKQVQQQEQYQNHQQNEPHLRQEIKKQRHEEMNGKLKTKQEEFSKLIKI